MLASVVANNTSERLIVARPAVVKGRCPYLSESRPLNGPAARVAMSIGMIRRPASKGDLRRTSWKYRLTRSRTAPKATAFRSWAATPPVNSRMRRSFRSRSGCFWLRSTTTNATSAKMETTSRTATVATSATP